MRVAGNNCIASCLQLRVNYTAHIGQFSFQCLILAEVLWKYKLLISLQTYSKMFVNSSAYEYTLINSMNFQVIKQENDKKSFDIVE